MEAVKPLYPDLAKASFNFTTENACVFLPLITANKLKLESIPKPYLPYLQNDESCCSRVATNIGSDGTAEYAFIEGEGAALSQTFLRHHFSYDADKRNKYAKRFIFIRW